MVTSATRARTIAATATELRIGVVGHVETLLRHALALDGSLIFLAPVGSPLGAAALVPQSPLVTATVLDVGPVPTADRIRGAVTMRGRPQRVERHLSAPLVAFLSGEERSPGRPVLELRPESITLDSRVEGGGVDTVPVEQYAAAQPDALAGWEAWFVRHLDADHASLLPGLAQLADPDVPSGWRVRPLLADAGGLVLRASEPAGREQRDVRLAFPTPATCGCDAVEAFNQLLERSGQPR